MKTTAYRPLLALLLMLSTPLLMTACNTLQGLGKDTQAAGKAIQKQADEEQDEDAHGDN